MAVFLLAGDSVNQREFDFEGSPGPTFDGWTFDYDQDHARLKTSLDRVAHLMRDGQWRTLRQIARAVGSSEAGVSARLRDLRKAKWKAIYRVVAVDSQRYDGGLWAYRVQIESETKPTKSNQVKP